MDFNYNCDANGNPTPAKNGITIWVGCTGEDIADLTCVPAPWSQQYLAAGWQPYRVGWPAVAAAFGQAYSWAAGPVYGAAAGTLILSGAGLVGMASGLDSAATVVFTSHGPAHLAEYGLSSLQPQVEAAITEAVQSMSGMVETSGSVTVDGYTFVYRAYPLANNVISIGTYYIP